MSFFLLLITLVVLGVLVTGIVSMDAKPIAVFKVGIDAIKSKIRWTP